MKDFKSYNMPKHRTIRRYTLILEKISRGNYPSFKVINDYLNEHDFEISERTIQRDISEIRETFGIEIEYDKSENGYWLNLKESFNVESFFRFLEIVNTAELLTDSLTESKDSLKYIQFDNSGDLKGIENLKPLLNAIKNRRIVEFCHTNFWRDEPRKYRVKPYLLKEFQRRWYVIGQFEDCDEFRTFGIERLTEVNVLSETFKMKSKKNPVELFENIIGVVYSLNKLQKVVLSFTHHQGKYVKTLPIHPSQRILIDNEKELRVELKIIPNYEFSHMVLSWGENVKVLEPQELVDEIKKILKDTLDLY